MDEVAAAIGMDPLAFRRRNVLGDRDLGATGQVFEGDVGRAWRVATTLPSGVTSAAGFGTSSKVASSAGAFARSAGAMSRSCAAAMTRWRRSTR